MITTRRTNLQMPMSEQEATKGRQSSPLLLPLLENASTVQPFNVVSEIASHITRLVEQRVLVSVFPTMCFDDQISDGSRSPKRLDVVLTEQLHQGVRRLLLVPWDSHQALDKWIDAAIRALHTVTGEEVERTTIAAPCIHVDGVSVRRAFEGLASVQDQLNPLVELFPGWGREYSCFSAGDVKIVLLHSPEKMRQQARQQALASSILKSLTAALCSPPLHFTSASNRVQWEKDGHIYAEYLVTLLCRVAESLQREN